MDQEATGIYGIHTHFEIQMSTLAFQLDAHDSSGSIGKQGFTLINIMLFYQSWKVVRRHTTKAPSAVQVTA